MPFTPVSLSDDDWLWVLRALDVAADVNSNTHNTTRADKYKAVAVNVSGWLPDRITDRYDTTRRE